MNTDTHTHHRINDDCNSMDEENKEIVIHGHFHLNEFFSQLPAFNARNWLYVACVSVCIELTK